MNLSDLIDLTDVLDMLMSWRFFVALAVGIGVGIVLHGALGGSGPGIAAVTVCGILGALGGFAWQRSHDTAG